MAKRDLRFRSLYGDGWTVPRVNDRELVVLSAASELGEADAEAIFAKAQEWSAALSLVDTGIALNSLEQQGLVETSPPASTAGHGIQHRFQVTHNGQGALLRAHAEKRELAKVRKGLSEEGLTETSS